MTTLTPDQPVDTPDQPVDTSDQTAQIDAEPIRVLLVDDAPSTRRFLRAVLDSTGLFDVVGEADSGKRAVEDATKLLPDVILLDLSLPDADGGDLLPDLLRVAPDTRVVILSNNSRNAGPGLVQAGAAGYVEKGLAPRDLIVSLTNALKVPVTDRQALAAPRTSRLETITRAVIYDDDPLTRRQFSWVLARCNIHLVVEILTGHDIAADLRSAVAMTGHALVILGEIKQASSGELIAALQAASPASAFISFGAQTVVTPRGVTSDRIASVASPDLEALEMAARRLLAASVG